MPIYIFTTIRVLCQNFEETIKFLIYSENSSKCLFETTFKLNYAIFYDCEPCINRVLRVKLLF